MAEARLAVVLLALPLVLSCGCGSYARNASRDADATPSSTSRRETADSIARVIHANYKAMEERDSAKVLSLYHPDTNLPTSKEQLVQFFNRMDMSYDIGDIRYIGDDGTNFVVIYHETTEYRVRNDPSKKVVEKVDTDVIMVFRKHAGSFAIFTSRTLKPGG